MDDNKKRVRRVGSITLAIMLILFGIIIFLQMFFKFDALRYILMIWPVLFISLGIEILICNAKKDVSLKIDGGSIFLMFIVIGFSCLIGLCNFAINQILYNDEIKEAIISENSSYDYDLFFDKELYLSNLTDKKILLKVDEIDLSNEESIDMAKVLLHSKYNEKKGLLFEMITNNWQNNSIVINRDDDGNSKMVIAEIPEFIDSIEIKIMISDKDKLKVNGNIEIID